MADKSREERNLGSPVGATVREREERSPPESCDWRE
jgi:hypothetical protein